MLTWAAAGPATSLAAAAAAALSSLVAQNEHAQAAAQNVGALGKLLRCGRAAPAAVLCTDMRLALECKRAVPASIQSSQEQR